MTESQRLDAIAKMLSSKLGFKITKVDYCKALTPNTIVRKFETVKPLAGGMFRHVYDFLILNLDKPRSRLIHRLIEQRRIRS